MLAKLLRSRRLWIALQYFIEDGTLRAAGEAARSNQTVQKHSGTVFIAT